MPGQVFIFWLALAPQFRRRWFAGRLSLAVLAAQWFWAATSARQSSTRSLLAPATLGLTVVSTKVPLEQPADDNSGMFLEPGGRVLVVVGAAVVVGGLVVAGGRVVAGAVVGGAVVLGVEHPYGGAQSGLVAVVAGGRVVVVGLVVVVVVMSRVRPAHPVGMDRLEAGHGAQPLHMAKLQRYCPAGQELPRGATVVVVGGRVVVVGRGLVVVVVVMSRVRPAHPVGMDRLEAGHGAHPLPLQWR